MPGKIQILHLEDNRGDRELVRALLAEGGLVCEIGFTQAREEFEQALSGRTWDIILADYSLPAFDGFAALAIARQLAPQVPFIFVTGTLGEEVAVETLKRGATDYVVKQRIDHLVPAVKRALQEAEAKRRVQEVEDKLRKTEQRFRLLIESITEYAIYMVDAGGTIVSWNAGAKQIFGYSEDEALGASIRTIFAHDNSGDKIFKRLAQAAQSFGRAEEELWLVRKDGTSFCGIVLLTPVYDTQPGVHAFAVITQDITERKRAAQEMEEGRQEREKMQERFLSHISHELRTPLTTIVDFTSLLAEGMAGNLSPEQQNYLAIVLQSANQLAEMVNSLLDLARSEHHRLPVYPEYVALEDLIGQICTSFEAAARAKKVSLKHDIPAGFPAVLADPLRVREILGNLIDNAMKYGRPGGEVEVALHRCDAEPGFIRISVRDDGPGIAPRHLRHIFERFFRASDGPDTNPGGLGLGLHITRELVRAHGGELGVSSKVGVGTTFQFTLPIFSLRRLIMPIVSPANLKLGRLALLTITTPAVPNCSELDLGRYRRSVREVLQSCTRAGEEIILPHMNIPGLQRKLHLVAFVEQKGAHAIVARLQERLGCSSELQPLEGQFEVSSDLVDFSSWNIESTGELSARLAVELSRLIGLDAKNGGRDERRTEEGPGDRGQPGTPDGAGDQVTSARL